MKHFTIDTENNITAHANRQAARETGAGIFSTEEQFADLIGPDNKRLLDIWNSLPGVKPVTKFANRKAATERIWKAIQNLGGPIAPSREPLAEIAVAEPVVQPSQPEPAAESLALPAGIEPSIAAAEPQPEPAGSTQAQEPRVAPVEASAQPRTPFDDEPRAEPQTISEPVAGQPVAAAETETQQPTAEPEVANAGAQGADVAPTEPAPTKKTTKAKKAPTGAIKPKAAREGSKTDTIISLLRRPSGATLKQIMEATSWQAHSVRGFVSGTLTKKMGLTVISAKTENGERTYSIAP